MKNKWELCGSIYTRSLPLAVLPTSATAWLRVRVFLLPEDSTPKSRLFWILTSQLLTAALTERKTRERLTPGDKATYQSGLTYTIAFLTHALGSF